MASNSKAISEQTGIRSYEEYKNTREVKSELGKDDFLSLLAAQLQYQNPLEPMSDTDFIAQLAQFSSLQQMQSLTNVMTTYQYYGLAGKYVSAEVTFDTGETKVVSGLVDRVITNNGTAYAQVGEYLIDCSKISQVWDKDLLDGNSSLLNNSNLIGKYVQAETYDENGKVTGSVVGKCTRISIENNTLMAHLDSGEKVAVGSIYDVSESEITPDPPKTDTGGGEDEGDKDKE